MLFLVPLLSLLLAPPSQGAPAESEVVRGVVMEKGTRRPLPGALVAIDGAASGESDEAGRFAVWATPGPHALAVSLPQFEPLFRSITVTGEGAAEVVRLAPLDAGPRYETVVEARADASARALSGEEARGNPGALGDPFRALASLPGVAQVLWPAAGYAIRGANPGNTGFFLDGLRVPALFHLALGPSVIHPYLIDEVDFFPAAPPARFGRYVAGGVSARTLAPPADRVRASADVRLYDAAAIATSGFDDACGAVAAAARYSYTGALFSLLSSD